MATDPTGSENVLVLERCETFRGYHARYGDAIARHYESNGVIVVPWMPIQFDLALFQELTWPAVFKKIGTDNGLARPVLVRDGSTIKPDQRHPLLAITSGDVSYAVYLQSQIVAFNAALTTGLQHLFPRYRLSDDHGITWRLTHTENEAPHLDVFAEGRPATAAIRATHRLKVFINLDTEPRHWRVSAGMPETLSRLAGKLPQTLPNDVNVLNDVVNRSGRLADLPWQDVRFPQMAAVIANGETVPHQVLFGRRTVCYEGQCAVADMLDPAQSSHTALAGWLRAAGFTPDAEVGAKADKYISGPPSYI